MSEFIKVMAVILLFDIVVAVGAACAGFKSPLMIVSALNLLGAICTIFYGAYDISRTNRGYWD